MHCQVFFAILRILSGTFSNQRLIIKIVLEICFLRFHLAQNSPFSVKRMYVFTRQVDVLASLPLNPLLFTSSRVPSSTVRSFRCKDP